MKNGNKRIISPLLITLPVMIVSMSLYELADHLFIHQGNLLLSHILSILISSAVATLITVFIFKSYHLSIKSAGEEIAYQKKAIDENIRIMSLLDSIVESTSSALMVTDLSLKIIRVNQKFSDLIKVEAGKIYGKDESEILNLVIELTEQPKHAMVRFEQLQKDINQSKFDVFRLKDGRTFELTLFPQLNGDLIIGRVWSFRDITQRLNIEKELAKSEQKYTDIFEKSDDGHLIILDGIFVDCNQTIVKMLKYESKKELLDTHPSGLSPKFQSDGKSSFEKANEMMNIALEKGSHRFEWEHKKADGEVFPVEVLLTAIDVLDDQKLIHTVWRDITDRKKVENLLKREQILLRTVIDNIPDALYVKDKEYRKTLANRMDLANMGCVFEVDALGKTDYDFSPKEIADGFFANDRKIIENGESILNSEESFLDKDGTRNWLSTSKIPLRDENGEIAGLIGIGHNITKRKKSEMIHEALYEISESAHNTSDMFSLYKNIHEIVSKLVPVKNIFFAVYDDEAEILSFPYMVDEFDEPYKPKKLGKGLTEYVLRSGEPKLINSEEDLRLREIGEAVLIGTPSAIWLGVPLKVGQKTIGVIVVQDYENEKAYGFDEMQLLIFVSEQIAQVIERKKKDEEISQYTEELKLINQTKDKLFSIIAHDLRSPFNGLLNISALLVEEIDSLTKEEIASFSNQLNSSLNKQYLLLTDLLDWARLQNKNFVLNKANVNLYNELTKVIDPLLLIANQKGVEIIISVEPDFQIYADDGLLKLILRNLISNGIKFSNLDGRVSITARHHDSQVEVTVSDNGTGISSEDIYKLFRNDIRHTSPGTLSEKGTGLGLLSCKEIVEKHGGEIWVESEVGIGSRFIFTLPN